MHRLSDPLPSAYSVMYGILIILTYISISRTLGGEIEDAETGGNGNVSDGVNVVDGVGQVDGVMQVDGVVLVEEMAEVVEGTEKGQQADKDEVVQVAERG